MNDVAVLHVISVIGSLNITELNKRKCRKRMFDITNLQEE